VQNILPSLFVIECRKIDFTLLIDTLSTDFYLW